MSRFLECDITNSPAVLHDCNCAELINKGKIFETKMLYLSVLTLLSLAAVRWKQTATLSTSTRMWPTH